MRPRSFWTKVGVLLAALGVIVAVAALPSGAQDEGSGGGKKVLRVGWAQDPQTLNPFVAQDEENFNVWSLTWDLLVGFNPDDLTPAPGIAEKWDISDDKKTVTFHLIKGAKWSDGQPITSKDVKYSLETLGTDGLIFTGYTDLVESIETPNAETVVVKTKQPDARIVGGLFVYMIPEHVYGKVPVEELTKAYSPPLPLVGSGPYIVTDYQRGKILTMSRNPNFRGDKPKFDEIQFLKFGTTDAVERALRLGDVDLVTEAQETSFDKLGDVANIDTVRAPEPSFTQLTFNLCQKKDCPDAKFNPGVQDVKVRQAIAFAVDRERVNAISSRGTSFAGQGIIPQYYKTWFQKPTENYPLDVGRANKILDDAGYTRGEDDVREKDGVKLSFDLFVRSESPSNTQAAKLVAEATKPIGVDFKVQVVSVDKLTEITTRQVDGTAAPDFDTFIWGWGGDPYDPSALLKLITTEQIGGSSDAFYSNPEYDALFNKQAGEFETEQRKATIKQMVDIAQRDLPYLVLTDDPNLQAYRTDRISGINRTCPKDTGDIYCEQQSYEPILALEPGGTSEDSGSSAGIIVAIIAVIGIAIVAFVVIRRRGRSKREPVELET